ncbi:hypothetical protein NDU88_003803 [Pleurodeles waltl]|uniref:Uncharacterized protein n=1 Tax=Pleurodeles waltl TaxID=8319 RepID=A0AAV7VF89_PLEWA|nr:hypothetical protein NDU88_003803 [Pleurodeles waltl]
MSHGPAADPRGPGPAPLPTPPVSRQAACVLSAPSALSSPPLRHQYCLGGVSPRVRSCSQASPPPRTNAARRTRTAARPNTTGRRPTRSRLSSSACRSDESARSSNLARCPAYAGSVTSQASPVSRPHRWHRISRARRRASSARIRHYQRLGHPPHPRQGLMTVCC